MERLDLRTLPKLRDGLSYFYCEHCKVEQDGHSIAVYSQEGNVQVPAASLGVLLLGPGSSITHAAVKTLADNGCLTGWTGEGVVRFYAHGLGETRKGMHIEKQAKLWADERLHKKVVIRMYRMRFQDVLPSNLSLQQIRGMEGIRVRETYNQASKEFGVKWQGRNYQRKDWNASDTVNRALSVANACLYAICHTAIISGGYSPALGFIHQGKALSFVYDIADLYKTEISIPVAFKIAAEDPPKLESVIRQSCRQQFYDVKLLSRILPDIDSLFDIQQSDDDLGWDIDDDLARPTPYWNPESENPENGD